MAQAANQAVVVRSSKDITLSKEGHGKKSKMIRSSKPNPPSKQFVLFRWLFGWHKRTPTKNDFHVKKPVSYLRLARERRFDDIILYLRQAKENKALIEAWLNVSQKSRVSTCESLHALCMYRPTAEAVQEVLRAIERTLGPNVVADPKLVTDASGRTPLHIAVACGCSIEVVEVLLRDDSEAVWTLDYSNRFPLHWACTKPNGIRSSMKEIENMVLVINRLMEAYAVAVISKDQDGRTPTDLAIAAKADYRIIKAFQFVTNILPKNITGHPTPKGSKDGSAGTDTTDEMPREAICIFNDDASDGISSIGSRGVSRHRRRRSRSILRKIPNLVFL
jgi:Ankyrin repeats (3 copies)